MLRIGLGSGLASRNGPLPSLRLDFLSGGLDNRITFTRGTTGTYFNSSGVLSSAAINTPRFDYDPVTLAAKGLLIEEARTNLTLYSEAFDTGANWATVNLSVTANASTSPSGVANADRAVITANSLYTYLRQVITVTASTTYTFSFWMNTTTSATGNTIRIFNVTGGSDIVAGQACVYSGGWVRQVCTFTTPVGCTSIAVYPVSLNAGGSSAGTYFDIWGAQLEAGAFATSYIPTVASTVTRSADVATMTGTNFSSWYNQSAGTFVVGADSLTTSSVGWLLTASDGTSNNRFGHYRSGVNLGGYVVTAAVTQMDLTLASVAANTAFKASVASTANDGNAAFNGAIAAGDTSITMPTLNKLEIGANNGAIYNGHIRTVAYFNTRLSNAQIQSLTA